MKPRRNFYLRLAERFVRALNIILTTPLNGWSRAHYYKIFHILAEQGDNCYFANRDFGSEPYLVGIGDNVVIASGVKFATHDFSIVMLRNWAPKLKVETIAPILLSNNIFVGMNTILLPGSKIGANTIIAAGSVVSGHLEGGQVYAGIPARPIRKIEEHIDILKGRKYLWEEYTDGDPKLFLTEYFKMARNKSE